MSRIKQFLFRSYVKGVEALPLKRGKGPIAGLLTRFLGRVVYDLNGARLELDPTSYVDRHLLSGVSFDDIVLKLIEERLKDGGVFVDVGAHIGYFSLMAARMPNTHVLAFEPSPRELRRLYRNLSLNTLPGSVTVLPYGLSDRETVLPLHIAPNTNTGQNSVADLSRLHKFVETVPCPFLPFDALVSDYLSSRIRLCKIDVEGHELSVLAGLAGSIRRMPEAVFLVEISPDFLAEQGQHPQAIYEFFQANGYRPRFGLTENGEAYYNEVFEKES